MKKYKSLDILRTIACIDIILMHIKANTMYHINGYFYNEIVPYFTSFVFLFMMLSAFSMCCGYYEKIKKGEITPNEFYKKRFKRILPFFVLIILAEVAYQHNFSSLIEGFMDTTLAFGLLPNNNLEIVGVGWFLGIIFIFYMMFPYFVFLLNDKKRAWTVLIISLLINFSCVGYFFTEKFVLTNFIERNNFLYDFIYFVIGGIIFLYKDQITKTISKTKINKYIYIFITIIYTIIYFIIPTNKYIFTLKTAVLFTLWITSAISIDNKVFDNKVTEFISKISMEMYLSHMLIFRFIEKIKLINLTSNDLLNYVITTLITICITIVFCYILKKILKITEQKYKDNIKPKLNNLLKINS